MKLIVLATTISLVVSLFGTPVLIRLLSRRGYSQAIRESGDLLYPDHESKKGTPSMGGLIVLLAVVLGYTAAHLYRGTPPTVSGWLFLLLALGLGAVGFADDYIKIFKRRSLGLRASTKFGGQLVVGLAFAALALRFPDDRGLTPASRAVSVIRDTPLVLPAVGFALWALLLVVASANAVNLTDGLDGLATGAAMMTFAAYTLIGVWQFGQGCAISPGKHCYEVRDPLDLAILAAAFTGACFGFLWWNAPRAQIFMGDTGSLAIGGAIAALAVLTRTEVLLLFLGGLFVIITMSVILQVGSFKLTGKRIFKMAPLQHHFELLGWAEVTIVIRFWIIAGLCIGGGLAAFYYEWVRVRG
ncbi:MAG TPA: phospho-N-acetylmuramoyl-pentapeptide-transferase [Actinobacteria bacterium]|nr:phospho-N-acetylmuramoyl-pentapeptide-transferase [Actinomycetota bacterium]